MASNGKIRTGSILVTVSSLLMVLIIAFSISGFLKAQEVIHDEDDFTRSDDHTLVLNYESEDIEVLIISIYADNTVDIRLKVVDEFDEEILNLTASTPSMESVPLEDSGRYTITVSVLEENYDISDLEVEIQSGGMLFLGICCFSFCFFNVFLVLIIAGAVMTYLGYSEIRAKRRFRRR